jgi:hypothetical protein
VRDAKASSATLLPGSLVRRAQFFSIAAAIAALVLLSLVAAPASAKIAYALQATFAGSGTNALSAPTGIAVDNSNGPSAGAVYVTDTTKKRVEKFDSAGNFLLMFGKGVNQTTGGDVCPSPGNPADVCQAGSSGSAAGQFTTPTFIAIDSSSGASKGDIYIGDTGTNIVQKFAPDGTLITSWGGTPAGGQQNGSGFANGPFSPIYGIAVDSSGNLEVFTNSGTRIFKLTEDGSLITSFTTVRGNTQAGLTVDSSGNFYKVNGDTSVEKVGSAGADIGQVDTLYTTTGLNIDPSTGDLFIVHGSTVTRHQFVASNQVSTPSGACTFGSFSGCAPTETFGSGDLTGATGLAGSTSGLVYIANTGASNVKVFHSIPVPDAVTNPVSNLARTSATLNGHVDPAGAGDMTSCHFDFGTTTAYSLGPVDCTDPTAPPYLSQTDVSADVSNLQPDTTYHYRIVAGNGITTITAGDVSFKTPKAVTDVVTGAATNVLKTSVTLNGSYTGEGPGTHTHYYFQYGPDTNYGQNSAVPPGLPDNGIGTQNLSFDLSGLHSNTVYHYRLVMQNDYGTTYGLDQSVLTAPPDLPIVDSTSASAVTQSSATLNSEINPGFGPTVYRFQYGPTSLYGAQTFPGGPIDYDSPSHTASVDISGLSPGTTYHFRVVATNFAGTTPGPDQTFTTPSAPLVGSSTASAITQTSATLGAVVNPSLSSTTYHFEYGASDSYGSSTSESGSVGADSSPHPAGAAVAGLAAGTTYHYRVVATNGIGTAATPDQTFTTAAAIAGPPSPTTCKAGFVKKHGKCVRKHHRRRHHKRHQKRSGKHA